MVNSQYEAILKDFESYFKCSLKPDENDTCLIKFPTGATIQIEMNSVGQLLIASKLGVIQGRYRENLIREALKANDFYNPSTGLFGISKKSDNLILYLLINVDNLNPDRINQILPPFVQKLLLWSEAIKNGTLPTLGEEEKASTIASPFGLR